MGEGMGFMTWRFGKIFNRAGPSQAPDFIRVPCRGKRESLESILRVRVTMPEEK